jgi:sulfane dehydrogenase subunit SoxC
MGKCWTDKSAIETPGVRRETDMQNVERRRGGASAPPLEAVAGNGLIHRRALLGRGVVLAGATATGIGPAIASVVIESLKDDPWSRELGAVTPALQTPSRYEDHVVRTLSNPSNEMRTSHARTPHHLINGTVTPNSLHFSINHSGIPDIDPDRHRLIIHGMVKQPLTFTLESLSRYPLVTRMAFVECSGNSAPMFSNEPVQATAQALHGLVSNAEWTGVPLAILLDEAGIDRSAKWLIAEGGDSLLLHRSVPVKKAYDDALVAIYQNGERIMPGNGYPMRLLLPGYQGNMNVKFLRRIKVVDQPAMGFYEARTYSQILPDGKAWRFHFLQEVKSFITQPSFGHRLREPGYYDISGIAYSGNGRISKVKVSADGGESWADAALQEPVLPKAFTRFRMPWRWDGQPVILQSRAWDEAGNAQPLRAEFVAMRGETRTPVKSPLAFPNQHYNSLTSWGIDSNGSIKHVYA